VAPLVLWSIAAIAWLALLIFFWRYRIWLMFYVVASIGLALLIIFAGTGLIPLEYWLEMATAYTAHAISQAVGIPTRVFEAAPGNILVWVIVQEPGWTIVRVDLECSGLLEMAVLAGLLLFYPAWSVWRRAELLVWGLAATYASNVIRVLSIIAILHGLGKRSIFVAHTIVGRLIFFALAALFYWIVFTRLMLRTLRAREQERLRT
jgi:exosortase family protein XrtG